MRVAALTIGLALAACARPAPDKSAANSATSAGSVDTSTSAPVPTPASSQGVPREDAWIGHWIGVEGMVLDVAAADAPGRYRLTMQWDLDHHGTFAGTATSGTEPGIAFERDGARETLGATDGAATGLKYLADKQDCLTVKTGEGYCRG